MLQMAARALSGTRKHPNKRLQAPIAVAANVWLLVAYLASHLEYQPQKLEHSGPSKLGEFLTPLDAATVDKAHSKNSDKKGFILFVNRSSSPVDIYWINDGGVRDCRKRDLGIGATWRPSYTFLTHPWLVVVSGTGTTERGTGTLLAGFEASTTNEDIAIITDPPGGDDRITTLRRQIEQYEEGIGVVRFQIQEKDQRIYDLDQALSGCKDQFVRPKIALAVLASEVLLIPGPLSEPWNGPAIMRPPTSDKIKIRVKLEISNEHMAATVMRSSGLAVFDQPGDSYRQSGVPVKVDPKLCQTITYGFPLEGWIEFQIDQAGLQSVVNRNFQVSIVDGTKTPWTTTPQKIGYVNTSVP